MAKVTVNGERVELFLPLAKFDERTGEFEAWATVEELDAHGEICDIEKSWPAIHAAAEEQSNISGGKSVGTLRRQHRRDTVIGKLTSIERKPRDGVDAVYVTGLATDKQSKQDAALGVLTGISIRGLASQWDDESIKGAKRYAWTLVEEQSMVDRPAVPHALIEVMKSDGTKEIVKAMGRQVTQYWDCLNATCESKHSRKDEAQKCEVIEDTEDLPTRVAATAKSEDTPEGAPHVCPTVDHDVLLDKCLGCVAQLGYAINSFGEEREPGKMYEGDAGHESVDDASMQKLWDAMRSMVNDLRARWMADEGMPADAPMDATKMLDALNLSLATPTETIKSLLRVPTRNGSKSTPPKEGTMSNEEEKKGHTAPPATGDEGTGDGELVKSLEAKVGDLASKLEASETARSERESELAKSLSLVNDLAAKLTAKLDEAPTADPKIDELTKQFADLEKVVNGLFELLPNSAPKGSVMAMPKESDGQDTAKGEATSDPWVSAPRLV